MVIKGTYKVESCGDGCCSWRAGTAYIERDGVILMDKDYGDMCPFNDESSFKEWLINYTTNSNIELSESDLDIVEFTELNDD